MFRDETAATYWVFREQCHEIRLYRARPAHQVENPCSYQAMTGQSTTEHQIPGKTCLKIKQKYNNGFEFCQKLSSN